MSKTIEPQKTTGGATPSEPNNETQESLDLLLSAVDLLHRRVNNILQEMSEMASDNANEALAIQATLFPLNLDCYTAEDEGRQVEVTLDGFTRPDTIVRANFPLVGEVFAPECILLRQTALESMREAMFQMTLQQDMLQAVMEEGDDE